MSGNTKYFNIETVAAIMFFLLLQPIFMWGTNMFFLTYILMFILMLNFDRCKSNYILFALLLVALSIIPFHKGMNIFGILVYVLLAFIPFAKQDFLIKTYTVFRAIFIFFTTVSIILWILFLSGLDISYSVVAPLNELKGINYRSYIFLAIPMDMLNSIRFHGMYDEPGAMGTYVLIMLFIDDFNFKKYGNIILLIAGILTFSLFFYISLFIFLLFKVFSTDTSRKVRILTILLIAAFVVAVYSVPAMKELIGVRLEYDAERKTIVGDNRSSEALNDYIASIRWTDTYLWGDTADVVEEFSGCASINNAILKYGFVFIALYFLFYLMFANNKLKNRVDVLKFMVLLFLTLYQRPGFIDAGFLFLFTSSIICKNNIHSSLNTEDLYACNSSNDNI